MAASGQPKESISFWNDLTMNKEVAVVVSSGLSWKVSNLEGHGISKLRRNLAIQIENNDRRACFSRRTALNRSNRYSTIPFD